MDELDSVLVKQATDLGILHLDVMGSPDPNALLADAIKTAQAIYDDSEYQKLADSLPPQKLTTCRIDHHALPDQSQELN